MDQDRSYSFRLGLCWSQVASGLLGHSPAFSFLSVKPGEVQDFTKPGLKCLFSKIRMASPDQGELQRTEVANELEPILSPYPVTKLLWGHSVFYTYRKAKER